MSSFELSENLSNGLTHWLEIVRTTNDREEFREAMAEIYEMIESIEYGDFDIDTRDIFIIDVKVGLSFDKLLQLQKKAREMHLDIDGEFDYICATVYGKPMAFILSISRSLFGKIGKPYDLES